MARGYMEKFLFVNLSTGEMREEKPDENLYRDFIGGYGIGARMLYNIQKAGVDPLGPDNHLVFLTGPFTGTSCTFAGRYSMVTKSPLTGGWGDSNSGGDFGPQIKFAGYDAVFINGVSDKPVYLFLNDGKPEIRDATHLWGKDCFTTEDMIKQECGEDAESVSIGVSGEKISLISCIITRRGAAAGRSGVGAVMGSKKLKAVAARGTKEVPVYDKELVEELRRQHIQAMRNGEGMGETIEGFHKYGTSNVAAMFTHAGDTPVKNWGGIGINELPDISGLTGDAATANILRRTGCWHCPVGCEGRLKAGEGEYKYPEGTRRVEYETQATFGPMCCNTNTESINMANHLCNYYGIDTISTGCVIAFAMECYEKGIITSADTDGIELTWGNHRAIIAMTEKICKREGFGDILADGVKIAAQRIGRGSEEFAIHVGGQEPGMHDPKFEQVPGSTGAARYQMDATPGRHTQNKFGPDGFNIHLANASGFCIFSDLVGGHAIRYITGFLRAVTGWDRSEDEILKCTERIVNMRHVFNLREGINPLKDNKLHPRITGEIPHEEGPLAGVRVNVDEQIYYAMGQLDWDRTTTKPTRRKLLELGLDDVAADLWDPK
ncbi:MAG: aldehyde ferredoxin oxidoreductase family protein [Dehalococcoidales bacterium]|nr:aldehyde ferredoxin oxidoreductase family protein [Dehalococcoidales bacterium]